MAKNRVNALHVYRTYFPDPPGGLQEAIRQIAKATSDFGVTNTIFTLTPRLDGRELSFPEARVIRERSWAAPASCDVGGVSAFVTFAKEARQADVLHYLFPWPFADVLHASVRPDVPAVMTYISDVVRQRWLGAVYAPLMWRTLKEMRVIVANCPAYARTSPVLSHPEIAPKVRVIPLGIDESSYLVDGDDSIFSRVGLLSDEPYFLFIGVLRYYKGAHFLVDAARKINARIVIAGSGPEMDKLETQVRQSGVKNVIFSGQVSDQEKIALLKNCRALVLPSHLRSEAYGMVLVEASIFGKPMISCEIGTGTSFVNLNGVTGFVVPPTSSDELARAMQLLLDDDHLSNQFGRAARIRYENTFSGSALGKAYSDLFHDVLS